MSEADHTPETTPNPDPVFTAEEQAQRRSEALKLCILSLVFHGGIPLVLSYLQSYHIIYFISAASYIAGWVFMIIARVRYKESRFAKVLMWVYIGILIAILIFVALAFSLCNYYETNFGRCYIPG